MTEIISLLEPLRQHLNASTLSQLLCIISAVLAMTGRITMLGISRWTNKGGSYRNIQRFFGTIIPWGKIQWSLIKHNLIDKDDVFLIGGDETTVTKSGSKTYGLDRFFSSLYGKPVKGLSFLALSIISVKNRISHPIIMDQMLKAEEKPKKNKSNKKKKNTKKKKVGRPKGSKNKNRMDPVLSPYLIEIQNKIKALLVLIGDTIKPCYFVFDGAFGNNDSIQMVRQCSLYLISKLLINYYFCHFTGKQDVQFEPH